MIWKETGVLKGSYMCFFNVSGIYRDLYYYMVSCGYFLCDHRYTVKDSGTRPPLLFFIVSGELELEYDGQHHTAGANDILLINCYKPQHYYCRDKCEFLFFHFDGEHAPQHVDRLVEANGGPLFRLANARDVYSRINAPIMKLCYQEWASDALLSSLVYSTLCMIADTGASANLFIPPHMELSSGMMSFKVIKYIDTHISQNFTVQELADIVNLSRHYFTRLFKKETGYSPLEYVAVAKINYAKLMLRTTTISIAEIAEFLGYSSSASFINAFRMRRGISPNRYRNNSTPIHIDSTGSNEIDLSSTVNHQPSSRQ